jgi:hypothetical protein
MQADDAASFGDGCQIAGQAVDQHDGRRHLPQPSMRWLNSPGDMVPGSTLVSLTTPVAARLLMSMPSVSLD